MRIILPTVALFITLAFSQADEEKNVPDFDQNTSGPHPVRKSVPERDQASFAEGHSELPWNAQYKLGPDSISQDSVPRGEVTKYHHGSEKVYPGVGHDYWLYIPKQYDETRPACLMACQDGGAYLGPEVNVPVVFDNLIHKGDMPVTIGLFVNPGGSRGRVIPSMAGLTTGASSTTRWGTCTRVS